MRKFYQTILTTTLFIFFFSIVKAQIVLTPSTNGTAMAQKVAGTGITISNVVFSGADGSAGFFKNVSTSPDLGIDSGIVLSTGQIQTDFWNFIDGIDEPAFYEPSNSNFYPGDADLDALSGGSTSDACMLEFDVVPSGDTIVFKYVFGSVEYSDYNCSDYNDILGFFISGGTEYPSLTNIALVPGTNIPVAINSINNGIPGTGENIDVCTGMGAGSPFTSLYIDNSSSLDISCWGFTTVLKAKANVTPGVTYHLKLAIADNTDDALDTNVFLEAKSLSLVPVTIISAKAYEMGNGVNVEWKLSEEMNMDRYEVERSTAGVNFNHGGTVVSTGNHSTPITYNWFDANPNHGANFYRVKMIDKNGQVTYSQIMKVVIGRGTSAISIYPNPVVSNSFALQFTDQPKGRYDIKVLNSVGQLMYKTFIDHNGGSSTQTIQLPTVFSKGMYNLEIMTPDNTLNVQKLVVAGKN
jgi:hypothetical protein